MRVRSFESNCECEIGRCDRSRTQVIEMSIVSGEWQGEELTLHLQDNGSALVTLRVGASPRGAKWTFAPGRLGLKFDDGDDLELVVKSHNAAAGVLVVERGGGAVPETLYHADSGEAGAGDFEIVGTRKPLHAGAAPGAPEEAGSDDV